MTLTPRFSSERWACLQRPGGVSYLAQTHNNTSVSLASANLEGSNNQMKRYLSAFLLSAGLLVSVATVKADDDDHHRRQRRYYDREHRDYHVYDQHEDRAYRSYLQERRYAYVSLARQRRERQREYWRWRHLHPGVVVEVR